MQVVPGQYHNDALLHFGKEFCGSLSSSDWREPVIPSPARALSPANGGPRNCLKIRNKSRSSEGMESLGEKEYAGRFNNTIR